ncbi:Peptide deformylase [Calidithermus terrae]|uniref:Peptide deformylase n=1 Tax=Calidithermus terrae TaxID=1408545 RepID=A0A399ER02_9DEIN|nr:peptide deformylase [Calidithermus terrae]RIH85459.1 Peptide deformylase [Calidithermus terrae]
MAEIYTVRLFGDPVLRKRALKVTDFSEIPRLAENMLETMFEARGVGLAAPQVGLSQRLFVWAEYLDDEEDEEEGEDADLRARVRETHVMVNPVITFREGQQVGTEGCLSIPGLYSENVPRALRVRVEYQDERGEPKVYEAEGYNAVVIQHELDHLDGVLYFERLPKELKSKWLEDNREDLARFQKQAKAFLKELKAKG